MKKLLFILIVLTSCGQKKEPLIIENYYEIMVKSSTENEPILYLRDDGELFISDSLMAIKELLRANAELLKINEELRKHINP